MDRETLWCGGSCARKPRSHSRLEKSGGVLMWHEFGEIMILEIRNEVVFGVVTGRFMNNGASLALGPE